MAFDRDSYRNTLLENIKSAKPASGGNEIVCRCFYCNDSKDLSHGHFYISIPKDDETSEFYCQKCHSLGYVTHKKLLEWGIFNPTLSVELAKYNKRVLKLAKNKKHVFDDTVYNLNNSFITMNERTDKKLSYINKRLGLNLGYNEILANKIVLNLKDLLMQNNITEYTRKEFIVNQLNDWFMGFLSFDNGFVNMRNLCKKEGVLYKNIDQRYVNYNIFGKYDNTKRFYVIPNNINLTKPEPIRLHLSEGAFDLLSIRYNVRGNMSHDIYSSINGSGYMGLCRYFINVMHLINLEVHIYPDADIDDDMMYDIADNLAIFNIPIYIHRNIYPGEKDFGVKPDHIKEYTRKIL